MEIPKAKDASVQSRYHITRAETSDFPSIDHLLQAAFEGPEEARLVERLRCLPTQSIELVSWCDAAIVGHIFLSQLEAPKGWGALAPLSVEAAYRKTGVGAALVLAAIAQAKALKWKALVVLGDPKYYHRFGFDVARAAGFTSPYPLAFTGILPLSKEQGAFEKQLSYPAAFEGV